MNAFANRKTAGLVAVTAAGLAMAALTWRTWPDAIYDFGSQLYYPWRMAAGQHLYTDIAYFNGPVSQWINTIAFKIFGSGLTTLVAVNLLIITAVTAVLWRLTSVVGALVFVLVFAFGQYVTIGNYNWVCPYTHEVTHGVALSLAAILLCRNPLPWRITGAGSLIGLVFLTKSEIFVPAALAIGAGLFLNRIGWRRFAIFIVAALIPVVVAFTVLTMQSGRPTGIRGVLGSWPWVFDRRIASLAFYRRGLGVDDTMGNAMAMLVSGAIELAAPGLILLAGAGPRRFRTIAVVLAGVGSAAVLVEWQVIQDVARPWPVFVALIALLQMTPGSELFRRPGSLEHLPTRRPLISTTDPGRAMLSIFALVVMGKMLLNARIAQYGFALAMPAGVVLADALLVIFPRWIAARGGDRHRAVIAAALPVTAVVAVHLYVTCCRFVPAETIATGTGPDQYFADDRGTEINTVLRQLDEIDPRGKTLAVFPQGLQLNYLARRPDPIAVVNLMPPEVISSGESNVVAMLQKSPPDAIILSGKDVERDGFVLTDGHYVYAKPVLDWIIANYQRRTNADPKSQLKLTLWTPWPGARL